jgi:hypothetical protein
MLLNNKDFFYPEINIQIGNYSFNEGVELDVYSSRESYFDWAKISFSHKMVEIMNFNKMDKAIIKLGYNGAFRNVFCGYVKNSVNIDMASDDEIILKDEMLKLEETKINEIFLDADPQEIIKFGLEKAGITDFKLSKKAFSKKNMVVISERNVINLIKQVHSIWDINLDFYFDTDGKFYWGENKNQDKIYEFEYGENIIDLTFENGIWILETISAPFIEHSDLIIVNHPKISGEFKVDKVHFSINSNGFLRSKIHFRG